ncbi:MAG: hypothetical protein FWF19_03830 [Euryarchaeota archaeon]|nr:hypothetical protein [Euryarchaeota archaeon]
MNVRLYNINALYGVFSDIKMGCVTPKLYGISNQITVENIGGPEIVTVAGNEENEEYWMKRPINVVFMVFYHYTSLFPECIITIVHLIVLHNKY